MYEKLFLERGLSLDRLRSLVEVCEVGSISRAVQGDPVRQSLYSRQLKELEEFFGAELTVRQGRRIALTPAGLELARLAREQLRGLSDFKSDCREEVVEHAIGGGESLLQWIVIPEAGAAQQDLKNIAFSLHNLRSAEVIDRLNDLTLDFGVIRKDAVVRPLKDATLGELRYALFVPRRLLTGRRAKDPDGHWILENLPLAARAPRSGFRRRLEAAAEKEGIDLNIRLHCQSFTEAAQALSTKQFTAVLPTVAAPQFEPRFFLQLDLPLLKPMARKVALAWNPRLLRIRPSAEKSRQLLVERLSF